MKIGIKFSIHVKEKIRSKDVKKSDSIGDKTARESLYQNSEHGTLIAVRKLNGNSIIVVYKIKDNEAKVITLFYTTKLDKLK